MGNQLKRSSKNKVILGLCGGVGESMDMDPNIVRLLFVVLTMMTGIFTGVIVYFILGFVVEEE